MATLKEVAREAGVSVSTVSHVVNGTRHVEPDTLARVQAAIARTGYAPNLLARALRRSSTDSIGIVVSDFGNPFYTDVIRGVEAACRQRGMTVLLANTDDDPERERDALVALRERRVDGLIVALTSGTADHVVDDISALAVPVVLIDRLAEAPVDQVGTTNRRSADYLADHLLASGHRNIAYLAGIPGISTSDERLAGYRDALERWGVEFDPTRVLYGASRMEPARTATVELLRSDLACTAIVAGNNLMALGALQAAVDLGRTVPEDLALVSFDDFPWTGVLEPRLTTMAQPSYEIGTEAIRLLLRRIADRDVEPRTIRLDPTFMHRDSCGCHLTRK